jgi:hypothetical protein
MIISSALELMEGKVVSKSKSCRGAISAATKDQRERFCCGYWRWILILKEM